IMDPNSSIERKCLREDNRVSLNDKVKSHGEWDTTECYDTADSGQKKEVVKKEFIVALKGEIYFVKFIINPEEYDIEPAVVFGRSFTRLTKGIADFENEIITIYPDLDPFLDDSDKSDDSADDWVDILEVIDFRDIPKIKGIDVPPYVCKMGKSSGNKKKSYSVMFDKHKLDGEVEDDEEEVTKEVIKGYKTLREKDDSRVFILPIRLEVKINSFALDYIGYNISVLSYRIYTKLGREEVKHIGKKITMLYHVTPPNWVAAEYESWERYIIDQ
ncbi:hypothetical protein Tco_1259598, partial [Tanacetum coccineum]